MPFLVLVLFLSFLSSPSAAQSEAPCRIELIAMTASPCPSWADLTESSEGSERGGTTGQSARNLGWLFTITPRFAYRIFTSQGGTITPDANNFQQLTLDLSSAAEFGATVSVAPPRWRKGEMVITVLAMPSISGLFETIVVTPIPFLAIGEVSANRLDVEALYRRRISDTDAFWVAGFEHLRVDAERRAPAFLEILDSDSRRRVYLAKGGVGGSLKLTASGRHLLSTDLLAVFGYISEKTDFTTLGLSQTDGSSTTGFDFASGYNFFITSSVTLNVGYRLQGLLVSQTEALTGIQDTDLQLVTGLELSVTIPF